VPPSEPFVGQARYLQLFVNIAIENSFLVIGLTGKASLFF
jgi:hypothetical protein